MFKVKIPTPMAPSLDQFKSIFPLPPSRNEPAIGGEWEYPEAHEYAPPPPNDAPLINKIASLYERQAYEHDGSGAHEISFPPCSLDRAWECGLNTTALFIMAPSVPVRQDGKCGRHIHISPQPSADILDALYEKQALHRAFAISAPFTASRVRRDGPMLIATFRAYVKKYARISHAWDDHWNWYSRNMRGGKRTLELRWNEQIPALSYPVIATLYRHSFDVDVEKFEINGVSASVDVKSVERFIESVPWPEARDVLSEFINAIGSDEVDTTYAPFIRSLDVLNAYLSHAYVNLAEQYDRWADRQTAFDKDSMFASCFMCRYDNIDTLRDVTSFAEYVDRVIKWIWW
jgi:hypothetical protein